MSVSSAVRQFGSAQGLGPKEQGSQIRATRFARIMGFRSQRRVVMFPMRTWTWSIVHSYGLAAVVGWFRSKLPTEAAGGTAATVGILIGEELRDHSSPGRVVSQWCY